MTPRRKPAYAVVAALAVSMAVVGLFASLPPLLSTLLIAVLGNLLAAELDRSGGAYARCLVRLAALWLPRCERERRIEEWEGDLIEAGEEGLRPVLVAWGILLIGAPLLAWTASRVGHLDTDGSGREEFAGLLALIDEKVTAEGSGIDRRVVEDVIEFVCACQRRAQRPVTGLILNAISVARICVSMGLDTPAVCAVLLSDVLEDGRASVAELAARFGEDVGRIATSYVALTPVSFQGRNEQGATMYRKMILARAMDTRVVLIKLAERLASMRVIYTRGRADQLVAANETLHVFAPLAQAFGIHAVRWELEDLAFATLHPRKYQEIKGLVAQQRDERKQHVNQAGEYLARALADRGIEARISGREKHFYSIYSKMTTKGREFNEIHDLTAIRVIVDSVKDCYEAVGVIHSRWKPLEGRFKDFIGMPKFNMYQSLHTRVIGPEGRPLEIQIRTNEMHELAEFGVAVNWWRAHRQSTSRDATQPSTLDDEADIEWLRSVFQSQNAPSDLRDFTKTARRSMTESDVYVFTPNGDVKSFSVGVTPLDFAYSIHTEIGHHYSGAKINGQAAPIDQVLQSGDVVEILTSKRRHGPSPDWLSLVVTNRARRAIKRSLSDSHPRQRWTHHLRPSSRWLSS